MSRFEHSIDYLRLYSYDGESIDDVIDELKALKTQAKKCKLTDVRVVISPRNDNGQIDETKGVDASLRMFVVARKRKKGERK